MFRRKKDEALRPRTPNPNPHYRPPMGQCNRECDVLDELKDVQRSIAALKQHEGDLRHRQFPMLNQALCATLRAAQHVQPRRFSLRISDPVSASTIEEMINWVRVYLNYKDVNKGKFDVDTFCFEVKDYVNNKEAILVTKKEIQDLLQKQAKLKESLGIE